MPGVPAYRSSFSPTMLTVPGVPLSIAVSETKGASSPTPIRMARLKSAEMHGPLEVDESGDAAATAVKAKMRSLEAMVVEFSSLRVNATQRLKDGRETSLAGKPDILDADQPTCHKISS